MTGGRDAEPEPEVIPAPEQPARTAYPWELPGGAIAVGRLASQHGWVTTRCTYARGPWMHSTRWTVLRIAESVVLRFTRNGQHVVAQWLDGSFEAAFNLNPLGPIKSPEMRDLLTREDSP